IDVQSGVLLSQVRIATTGKRRKYRTSAVRKGWANVRRRLETTAVATVIENPAPSEEVAPQLDRQSSEAVQDTPSSPALFSSRPASPQNELVAESSPRRAKNKRDRVYAQLDAGVDFAGRRFSYNEFRQGALRTANQGLVPMVAIRAEAWPLGTERESQTGLVLRGRYAMAFGGAAAIETTEDSLAVSWSEVQVGAGYSLALTRNLTVEGAVAGDLRSFDYGSDSEAASESPSVEYLSVTPSAAVTFRSSAAIVRARLGYLAVLSSGPLGDEFFPRSSTNGAELQLDVTRHLSALWWVQVNGGFTMFGHTLNPEVGDAFVAGGARDMFFRVGATTGVMF
ncbi:MAG: hypothetical protein AAFY60_17675, partial [Myxococcota bacterium]